MGRRSDLTQCYIDESIHEALGFVTVSFVFAAEDLNTVVSSALASAGLDPGREEFKSGARMKGDTRMGVVRKKLIDIINAHTRVAVVFAPYPHRVPLGKQCLRALQSTLIRNGIRPEGLTIHVDHGIFPSRAEAERLIGLFRFLKPATFRPDETSHVCQGIQLADLIAHTFALIIRGTITGSKLTKARDSNLSQSRLASIRYSILARCTVSEQQAFDSATDPVVIGPEDDPAEHALHPEVLGWGVQVAPEAPDSLRGAVRGMLDRVWLGCMH